VKESLYRIHIVINDYQFIIGVIESWYWNKEPRTTPPNSSTVGNDLSTQNHVTYPKIIPYSKFEHFRIIRFWVMFRTFFEQCTY